MATAYMRKFTVAEILALPEDGLRHELLYGEHVVSPTPSVRHQRAVFRLAELVQPIVSGYFVELFPLPGDLQLNDESVLEPDLFLLPMRAGRRLESWADAPVPLLVVEVLSPRTKSRDRGIKREIYLSAGVEEYWIVDCDARAIERWRPGAQQATIEVLSLVFSLKLGISGSINLPAYFASFLD